MEAGSLLLLPYQSPKVPRTASLPTRNELVVGGSVIEEQNESCKLLLENAIRYLKTLEPFCADRHCSKALSELTR